MVFAKKPFGNANSVVEYLGRYTHKIAISNHRIKNIDNQNVSFDYKDYRQNGIKKQMTLSHQEFIRRFSLAYFAQAFCQNPSLWIFEQYLETSKAKAFTGKTSSKVLEKAEKKAFFTQMSLL